MAYDTTQGGEDDVTDNNDPITPDSNTKSVKPTRAGDTGDEADEDAVKERINNEDRKRRYQKRTSSPPCRTRFDVLSTPNRRLILDLYQKHAYHLSQEKVERIKELLQELYAMTPEETKKYFMELEQENSKKRRRKRLKELLRKQYLKQKKHQGTVKAYKIFAKILRKGMIFAISHSVPPLVTVRLRYLSDIILEQLSDLRNVKKPNREDPSKEDLFLITVSDWIAVGIEQVYYEVQLKKNEELEKLGREREELESTKKGTRATFEGNEFSETANKNSSEKELLTNETKQNQWED